MFVPHWGTSAWAHALVPQWVLPHWGIVWHHPNIMSRMFPVPFELNLVGSQTNWDRPRFWKHSMKQSLTPSILAVVECQSILLRLRSPRTIVLNLGWTRLYKRSIVDLVTKSKSFLDSKDVLGGRYNRITRNLDEENHKSKQINSQRDWSSRIWLVLDNVKLMHLTFLEESTQSPAPVRYFWSYRVKL